MSRNFVLGLGVALAAFALWLVVAIQATSQSSVELLNASYDPTRELWRELNDAFIDDYEHQTGSRVVIRQSHGGSSSQARSVIDGLEADVITLALWSDTDAVRKQGLVAEGWEDRLPDHSLPYFSTIVFVVRKGNPHGIHDWPDLLQPDVQIITPNPKTSGNGKLSLLAAWAAVIHRGGSEDQAREFIARLYGKVPVLDTGARGATTTFAQKGIGDVHLTWENEAHLEVHESGGELEIIYPTVSIRAEPHVAIVDRNVDWKRTRPVAEAYLNFLYTEPAQEIIARNHYRPGNEAILKKHADTFPPIELVPPRKLADNWDEIQQKFFAEGGLFDQVFRK